MTKKEKRFQRVSNVFVTCTMVNYFMMPDERRGKGANTQSGITIHAIETIQ